MSDTSAIEPIVVDRAGLAKLGINLSNQWLLDLEAAGKFPKRLSIGGRRVCWLLSEVRAFIEQRAGERDASAAERRRVTRPGSEARTVQRPA